MGVHLNDQTTSQSNKKKRKTPALMMEGLSDVSPRFKHPTVQAVEKIESTSELH